MENRNIWIAVLVVIVLGVVIWLFMRKREPKVVVTLPDGSMGYADALPAQAGVRGTQPNERNIKVELPPPPPLNPSVADRINLSKPLIQPKGLKVPITLENYRQVPASQRRYFATKLLGNKAMKWNAKQIYEWLYAYLKGADYFFCNNCNKWWGSQEYYTTRTLVDVGGLENIPAGAKYVQREGGELITK